MFSRPTNKVKREGIERRISIKLLRLECLVFLLLYQVLNFNHCWALDIRNTTRVCSRVNTSLFWPRLYATATAVLRLQRTDRLLQNLCLYRDGRCSLVVEASSRPRRFFCLCPKRGRGGGGDTGEV